MQWSKLKSRVVGTFGRNGTVDGVFKPKKFKAVNGQLVAVGKLKADDWQGRRGVQLEIEDGHDPRRMHKT